MNRPKGAPEPAPSGARAGGEEARSVPRVRRPSASEFEAQGLRPLRPLVITELFRSEPLGALRSLEALLARLGSVTIPVDDQYDQAIGLEQIRRELLRRCGAGAAPTEAPPRGEQTLSGYFASLDGLRSSSLARVAFDAPPELRALFDFPSFCAPGPGESRQREAYCFIGARGSFSQVHFDKDGTHGLVYQLVGRKRFLVWPARAASRLGAFSQFGVWLLHNFSDRERAEFLAFTGGQEAVIGPGECIYLPAFCWHFADYIDDCWALNLRFRRDDRVTRLVNVAFPDAHTQAIGELLARREEPGLADRLLEDLEATSGRDGKETVERRRLAAQRWHHRIEPTAPETYLPDMADVLPSSLRPFLDMDDPRRPRYS